MTRIKHRTGAIAALDIGSSKVCCLIARADQDGVPHIAGIGHNMSRGVRGGALVDLERIEASILAAVNAAEKMAGVTIEDVLVNLSGGQPQSATHPIELPVGRRQIGNSDIRRLNDHKEQLIKGAQAEIIHAVALGFRVDGRPGVGDPRGLFGDSVGLDLHVVSAQSAATRNLETLLSRCHLEVEEKVVAPFAAGLAALTADQRELGATVIDMGANTSSVAVFRGGQVIFTDTINLGGEHVTKDVAYGLTTSLSYAERIKTLYGSAMISPSDDQQILEVPMIGDEDENNQHQVPRSMLNNIIKPRLEETFELIRNALEREGLGNGPGRTVTLTGGAAQLSGIPDLAGAMFDRPATLARPHAVRGLAEATSGPAFSVAAGLLVCGARAEHDPLSEALSSIPGGASRFGRIGAWLKEKF